MTDETNAASEKTPIEVAVEHVVEALVYAPIGLLFEGASLLPQLIEKGRNQVTMARMIGKFAVEQGQVEATKAAGRLQDQAAGVLDFIGGTVTPIPGDEAAPTPPAPKVSAQRKAARPTAAAGTALHAARKVAGVVADTIGDAATLSIPDYDGLSASHVVNRLASLSPGELESVRVYEMANRGRKTILSKVAQLQSS